MRNFLLLGLIVLVSSGCAADLSSGNKFSTFGTAPEDKALVFFVRNDNFMAAKIPYVPVLAAKADKEGKATEVLKPVAYVGKDMFVSALMEPGDYLLKSGSTELFSLKAKEIKCIEVGAKFRGITIYVIEPLLFEECQKVISDKDEGVQLAEAIKRINN